MESKEQVSSKSKYSQPKLEQEHLRGFSDDDAIFENLLNTRFKHMKKFKSPATSIGMNISNAIHVTTDYSADPTDSQSMKETGENSNCESFLVLKASPGIYDSDGYVVDKNLNHQRDRYFKDAYYDRDYEKKYHDYSNFKKRSYSQREEDYSEEYRRAKYDIVLSEYHVNDEKN